MWVRCLYSGLVGGLLFVARVALLACVGGLAFVVCAFSGLLLYAVWFDVCVVSSLGACIAP